MKAQTKAKKTVAEEAEASLFYFACLVNPSMLYGHVHREVFNFLQRRGDIDQLVLLPRGHLKSHMLATWCAWWITKHPDTTILYVSATEDLATQQLYAIKGILESTTYSKHWPLTIHPEEAKREEWNYKNIKVDHPLRKERGVRDRTVAARSVGSNTTGLHADVLVFDDLVVPDNAYTEDGRQKVSAAYSQFSSVANTGAISKVAGTRYHGKDVYNQMLGTHVEQFDQDGQPTGSFLMYSVLQKQVEEEGDFVWPRTMCPKTKRWFGFNQAELAKIKAKYFAAGEKREFYGQYYNNPQDPDDDGAVDKNFQYYNRKYLTNINGEWHYNGNRLAVFAAADLAYTEGVKSDYTAIVVIGLDASGFIYILDMDQFKTTKYHRIYEAVLALHKKWRFKRLRMETNSGANLVVQYVMDECRKEGVSLVVEGERAKGEKTDRCNSILMPRYHNKSVFHYEGGLTNVYEEQITLARPSHDDLRDAMAAAVEISKAPGKSRNPITNRGNVISINERFGGRVR